MKLLPYLMIAAGASLWGIIGFFVKALESAGFSSMEIVAIRALFASFFLILIGFVRYREQIKLKTAMDIRYFVGTGIFSIVFFNYCYFTTMSEINISMAVIFLYTAPAFVTILSYFFLKESMNLKKIMAVILTISGCVLIAGLALGDSNLTFTGILTGLGSGLGYAFYTIFSKFALAKYTPFAITFYTFLVAAICLIPVTKLWEKADLLLQPDVMLFGVSLGLIPTVLAYILYTWGLEKTEGSKAAVIATVEPIVATMMGVFLYNESLAFIQIVGATLIISSVIIVNLPGKNNRKTTVKTAVNK